MKERPILFSGPMVRAILEGRKTQTRRAAKDGPWARVFRDGMTDHLRSPDFMALREDGTGRISKCPQGAPGDRLWVRETWYCDDSDSMEGRPPRDEAERAEWLGDTYYRADVPSGRFEDAGYWAEPGCWKPSIFMPRWASRLTLEVTDVRVERLQDISEEDAKAEGVELDSEPDDWRNYVTCGSAETARESFESLWQSINGPESWDANPWVWAISFKRVA